MNELLINLERDLKRRETGVKHDTGKSRLDLIPSEVLFALGDVLHEGSKKYGERNWEQGMEWGRVYGALQRHLCKWWSGIDLDEETGKSHLHHALANLAFLLSYEQRGIGTDTRNRPAKT